METFNNMTSAASKAIWGNDGSKGEEPASGVQGDTSKGEPYDAGNMGEPPPCPFISPGLLLTRLRSPEGSRDQYESQEHFRLQSGRPGRL